MIFKVLVSKNALSNVPTERRDQIKEALKELESPFGGGNQKKLKGYKTGHFLIYSGATKIETNFMKLR
ncbi:type II toxin-antitoxin system RelE family toxin [Methanosarcina vacuolata]|uniref:RelE/StbE replicon stabilization toxin n=1 Tax=Methanosarcina vacuolata Z-761 TaxID=1434123 RepID=A0A0E3Q7Q8_9EURY|nr:hypothetical protein [Methanosarcina vacuolata]AKB44988.1 hypothetical protein MSVAZ_2719 [Methanosarcina vacuolata Z-761]